MNDEHTGSPAQSLPLLCRVKHILMVIPIARSTLWAWVRQGLFPKPFKYHGLTAWKREDVLTWLENAGRET